MENGTYGNANTDFRKLVLRQFSPHLFYSPIYSRTGCGSTALALITGENPYEILKKNKCRFHCSDSFMRRFLKSKGIASYKITKCNLTSRTKKADSDLFGTIAPNNLVLASQLLKENEASWFVYWDDIQYHNFELSRTNFAALLNFPIISSYVLYNPKWANKI